MPSALARHCTHGRALVGPEGARPVSGSELPSRFPTISGSRVDRRPQPRAPAATDSDESRAAARCASRAHQRLGIRKIRRACSQSQRCSCRIRRPLAGCQAQKANRKLRQFLRKRFLQPEDPSRPPRCGQGCHDQNVAAADRHRPVVVKLIPQARQWPPRPPASFPMQRMNRIR